MQEVDTERGRECLDDVLAYCRRRADRARLRRALDDAVEYLANSRDPMVIALLNEYPFRPTRRNIPGIKATTEKLLNRLNTIPDGIN